MATVKTRRVELAHTDYKRGIHTAYVPDATLGTDDAGNAKQTRAVPFMRGRAEIDEQSARRVADVGLIKK